MTKDEYQMRWSAVDKKLRSGVIGLPVMAEIMELANDHIASLEAENERLTKAVEKAIGTIHDFTQFCPREYLGKCMKGERCACRKYEKECWKLFFDEG